MKPRLAILYLALCWIKRAVLTIGVLLMIYCNLVAQDTLLLDSSHYLIDKDLSIALCNSPLTELNGQGSQVEAILLDQVYVLPAAEEVFELGQAYMIEDSEGQKLQLYFTELPLLMISASALIVDEPRVFAELSLQASQGEAIQANIGIEYKGGWTQTLEKKSFRIELWADSTGLETEKLSLLGMRSDDDWNLEAMFNEPLRMRNVINAKLWQNLHSPYYITDEPEAKGAIELQYVELFLDGQYRGVYALSERIDRKLLQLKKSDETRRGELFKAYSWGASTFGTLPDYNNLSATWGGFDHIYPEDVVEWKGLYDFIDFVINGQHATFYEEWDDSFDRSNAIDYFIFLNAIRALDNTGKNTYVARYDVGEPYFYVPFDLDGTYGLVWNGQIDDVSEGILSNGFYDRLLLDCKAAGFSTELKARWAALRDGILANSLLKDEGISHHDFLKVNGVYEREEIAWPSYDYKEANLEQFTNWIDKRMELMDNFFELLCEDVATKDLESNQLITLEWNSSMGKFELKNTEAINDFSCKIYNSLGQLCYYSKNNPVVDFASGVAGSYVLVVEYGAKVNRHKITIPR